MNRELPIIKGRGTEENPPNRFEQIRVEADFEHVAGDEEYLESLSRPRTHYFVDSSRTIIATNDSPDVGFTHSLNPYRGCLHGCVYCYARPTHEYLGFSAGLDFETKIMVKRDAPELLREEMSKRGWTPKVVSIGGVTDPYQPAERHFKITRRCLEVFREFRNPATVITKNHLVTRDLDVLSEMAKLGLAAVFVSVTTLDPDVMRVMEPRTAVPQRRLDTVRQLSDAGVPVGVMVAPVVPGLTDHEMPKIIEAAAEAGACTAAYVPVRLPFAVKDLFEAWLERHFPDRKDKVLNRIRSMRGGKLNDANFVTRMQGSGPFAEQIKAMFTLAKRRAKFKDVALELRTDLFRLPPGPQLRLFAE